MTPDGRVAGRLQAVVLLAGSCLPILGALLIAPILPDMQDYFSDRGFSAASQLAPIALAIPSLAVALFAPFAGRILDKVGRLRLLLWSLPLYVVAGTAPLWLNVLPGIVLSRALIGIAEAVIMTTCITLIGDYYAGKERDRYLSMQAMVAAFSAVVFLAVGGALGDHGWRTPFWVYFVGIIFIPIFARTLWTPKVTHAAEELSDGLAKVPWKRIAPLLILSVLGAIVFYALQVELSYVLDDLGVSSGGIGASAALDNLGLAIAAVCFGIFNRGKASGWLVVGLLLAGLGLILLALGHNWGAVTAGAIVAGVGGGMLLPALLVGTTSLLKFEDRGRGTGAWTSAFYLGQFISPIVVNGLKAGTGELTTALKIVGVFGIVLAVAAFVVVRRTPLTTNVSATTALAAAEAVEPPIPTFEAGQDEKGTQASTTEAAAATDADASDVTGILEVTEVAAVDPATGEVAAVVEEIVVVETASDAGAVETAEAGAPVAAPPAEATTATPAEPAAETATEVTAVETAGAETAAVGATEAPTAVPVAEPAIATPPGAPAETAAVPTAEVPAETAAGAPAAEPATVASTDAPAEPVAEVPAEDAEAPAAEAKPKTRRRSTRTKA